MSAAVKQFRARYGVEPTIRIEAPGRVNLIGEHIDYLDGWVMPAAIEPRITLLAAHDPSACGIEVWSAERGGMVHQLSTSEFKVRSNPEEAWLNYLVGVLAVYGDRGIRVPVCRVGIFSTLPSGAGLSSSAALETAMALLVEALIGKQTSARERALLCQKAEHDWVGVPCGIMDQFAVGMGAEDYLLKIDCRDLKVEPTPLPRAVSLVIADSGVKHALGDGEYRKRRDDCEAALAVLEASSFRDVSLELVNQFRSELGDRLFRRVRHVVTEMRRAGDFANALKAGQLDDLGRLMRAGHDSLKNDFEVSCAELDFLVDAGYAFGPDRGQLGSRMTGGGFGGSTVHLVREEVAPAFLKHLKAEYRRAFDVDLNCFVTRAAGAAKCELILSAPSTR
ncbi:MAG: galactokinase [Verrucomicrobiales bacterium]|nr:galactokinase [Verrucomicrobiales bacterium]